jgi:hypothetical protein
MQNLYVTGDEIKLKLMFKSELPEILYNSAKEFCT